VKRVSELRPEVTDPKALCGWLWHHGMKRLTKKRILEAEEGKKGHDPMPLRRKKVLSYKDYPVKGLIRLLFLEDGSIFPEYALYGAAKAGLRQDHIVRTNDYNLFVYREG
jgi:hypothetical protein